MEDVSAAFGGYILLFYGANCYLSIIFDYILSKSKMFDVYLQIKETDKTFDL